MLKKLNLKSALFAVNAAFVCAIFVLNFFYQYNHFSFTLKCITSALFALLGLINLSYALYVGAGNRRFYIAMAGGLLSAFLGDVFINESFIVGAALFALGHICFIVAYVFLDRLRPLELIIGGVAFASATAFLIFYPYLSFSDPIFRVVCIIYALIISLMLGKAVANLVRERTPLNALIAVAAVLFVISDLMLVFAWFAGVRGWTDNLCMATYYPALSLLATSMYFKIIGEPR